MNRQQRRQAARVREVRRPARASNPIEIAIAGARKLTGDEVRAHVAPARAALEAMRRGVGGLEEWQQLASAVNVSKAIERQGIVRGLAGHLEAAEATLATVHRRACEELREVDQGPQPYRLHLEEIDTIATAIELLFDYQLQQLSRRELQAAMAHAEAEVRSSGGEVIERRPHVQETLALERPTAARGGASTPAFGCARVRSCPPQDRDRPAARASAVDERRAAPRRKSASNGALRAEVSR